MRKWLAENKADIVVVSGDGDFNAVCKTEGRLHYEPRLEKYLQDVGAFHAAVLSFVIDAARSNEDKIAEQIKERFENLGFWFEDQDGEVENVEVTDLAIEDVFVIKIEDEEEVTLELTVRVSFTCDLHYDDMNTAVYDSEDKRYIVLNRITEADVEREEEIPVELRVAFVLGDEKLFEILEMTVNQNKDVGILQDDQYPYK